MYSSTNNMKISTINDHNYDETTDKLYDPLRTVVMHPEQVKAHQVSSPKAAQKSLMHDRYQQLSEHEAAKLVNSVLK